MKIDIFLLGLCFLCYFEQGVSRIETQGPHAITKNKTNLTITCKPYLHPDVQKIVFIRLRSDTNYSIASRKSKIARVSPEYNIQYAKWMDMRYHISGSTSDISSAYLRLEIPAEEIRCSDSGTYRCEMLYQLINMSYVTSSSESHISVSDYKADIGRAHTYVDKDMDLDDYVGAMSERNTERHTTDMCKEPTTPAIIAENGKETSDLKKDQCDTNWLNERRYLIAGIILAFSGTASLILASCIYRKAKTLQEILEKSRLQSKRISGEESISYSKIDDETRSRYTRISQPDVANKEENPYTSLGDLTKYEESVTRYTVYTNHGNSSDKTEIQLEGEYKEMKRRNSSTIKEVNNVDNKSNRVSDASSQMYELSSIAPRIDTTSIYKTRATDTQTLDKWQKETNTVSGESYAI